MNHTYAKNNPNPARARIEGENRQQNDYHPRRDIWEYPHLNDLDVISHDGHNSANILKEKQNIQYATSILAEDIIMNAEQISGLIFLQYFNDRPENQMCNEPGNDDRDPCNMAACLKDGPLKAEDTDTDLRAAYCEEQEKGMEL